MAPEVVYRSNHPDALAHEAKYIAKEHEWRARVRDVLVELGFEPTVAISLRGSQVVGVVWPAAEAIPDGWRRDRDERAAIVPARRVAAGRKAGARLDTLKRPDPRNDLPGGMPSGAFAAKFMASMQPGVAMLGGYLVVTWSGELQEPTAARLDPAVWERIRLSEYWAMREAAEAESAVTS